MSSRILRARRSRNVVSAGVTAATLIVSLAFAPKLGARSFQDPAPGATPEDGQAPAGEVVVDEAQRFQMFLDRYGGRAGPLDGAIGPQAHVQLPEGMLHFGPAGTKRWLEDSENPSSENEVATLLPDPRGDTSWFAIFAFVGEGYVKDDDKNELDADDLLKTLREGTAAGNEERERRGWGTLELVGWEKPPFYDEVTKNLTWATRVRDDKGNESVNWTTRLLGRRGYMQVDLVVGPDKLQSALPAFTAVMNTFEYKDGERYANFVDGDKVAEYGLGALVVGGAGVAAAKLGILAKFWKVLLKGWKFVLFGVLALGASLKNVWKKFFGRDPKLDARSGPSG